MYLYNLLIICKWYWNYVYDLFFYNIIVPVKRLLENRPATPTQSLTPDSK